MSFSEKKMSRRTHAGFMLPPSTEYVSIAVPCPLRDHSASIRPTMPVAPSSGPMNGSATVWKRFVALRPVSASLKFTV